MSRRTARDLRSENRFEVLHALFELGPSTRRELARHTGLSPATVATLVTEFLSEGVLHIATVERNTGGRPQERLTINYRLGAMGYLATAALDDEARDGVSGNFGMLDQQAALRWVRASIGRFGGDPGRVTIAGESAGGRSVCTQLASPTGKGLFRAGIVRSGAYGDCAARTHEEAVAQGKAFTEKLGCTTPACLRGKSAEKVLAAQAAFDWGPVTGGDFLPVQPFEAFEQGAAARVPVLNGANQDEGRMFAFSQFDNNGTPLTAEQYPAVMRPAFGERALERYPLSAHPSPTIAFGTALGDQLVACPALRLDDVLAARGPVYAYEFADRTSPPFASLRNLNTDFDFGATHVNEVQYLFKHFGLDTPLNAEQRVLARQMVQYWGPSSATACRVPQDSRRCRTGATRCSPCGRPRRAAMA